MTTGEIYFISDSNIHDNKDKRLFAPKLKKSLDEISNFSVGLLAKEKENTPSTNSSSIGACSSNFTYINLGNDYSYNNDYSHHSEKRKEDGTDLVRLVGGLAFTALALEGFWFVGKFLKQRESLNKCLRSVKEIEKRTFDYESNLKKMDTRPYQVCNLSTCIDESQKLLSIAYEGRQLFHKLKREAVLNLLLRVGLMAFAIIGSVGAIMGVVPLMAVGAIGTLVFVGLNVTNWVLKLPSSSLSAKAQSLHYKIAALKPSDMLMEQSKISLDNTDYCYSLPPLTTNEWSEQPSAPPMEEGDLENKPMQSAFVSISFVP